MINSKELNGQVESYFTKLKTEKQAFEDFISTKLNENEEYVFTLNEIGKTKFLLAKATYLCDKNLEKTLNEKLKVLEEKKSIFYDNFLKNTNFSKYEPKCKICNDEGFINNVRCKCYYKKLTEISLNYLGVSQKKHPKFSNEVPPVLEKIYNIFKEYTEKFPKVETKNFVFLGQTGTGKTYLSECVFSEIENKGLNAIYLTSNELNQAFLKMHLDEIDKLTAFNVLVNSDFLVIDDLGTEPIYKNVTVEYLLSLISQRIEKGMPFIITTNLTTQEISERYNERLLSRLNSNGTKIIPFYSKDLRLN